MSGKILGEFSEVDSSVGREIKHYLGAIHHELNIDEFHLKSVLGNLLGACLHCIVTLCEILPVSVHILFSSLAFNRLERCNKLFFFDEFVADQDMSELKPSGSLNDYHIAQLVLLARRIKKVCFAGLHESDADYFYHVC